MAIEVSAGTVNDVDSLAPLWMALVEHHREVVGQQCPVRAPEQAWSLRRQQYLKWLGDASGLLLVARVGEHDGPVGYVFCRLLESGPTFDLGPVRGEVDSLVVADTARGASVGSALLSGCRAGLQRRGVSYWSIGVVEANSGAVQLYERLGFRPWTREMLALVDEEI